MRKTLLAVALAACTPGTNDSPPPIEELPAGVWEPAPGAWIFDASLVADGGTVWWAYLQHIDVNDGFGDDNDVWLTATSPAGTRRVTPSRVTPGERSIWSPQIAVTPTAVMVATRGERNMLRRFDPSGAPLGNPSPIAIDDGTPDLTEDVRTIKLVATPAGGAQLVGALVSDTAEIAIVDLDASGTPTRTVRVGTPDTTEPGGSATNAIAVAPRPDGSTLVAWDRYYNGCVSTRPPGTLTAQVVGPSVGAIQPVRDEPDRGELLPAVAAAGSTAYIVWQSGTSLAFAKHPDTATVIAEVGDPNQTNHSAWITLAAPGRGAIAWTANGVTDIGEINVMAFEESNGSVSFGTPRTMPSVDPQLSSKHAIGLAHVGDDRYVFAWIETHDSQGPQRLYATEVDLATESLRPAPPVVTRPPRPDIARRAVPCP